MSSDIHADPSAGENRGALVTLDHPNGAVPALPWPYGNPTRPEILTSKAKLSELLHALRRRWMLAVGLGVVVAVSLASLVWYLVPIRYEAVALLRVSNKSPYVINPMGGATGNEDFVTYKRTQAQLMKSHFVLSAALREPRIMQLNTLQQRKQDPLGWLEDQLLIDYPGDAEVLRLSMKGDRPDDLVKIVNAVKDSYMTEIVNAERDKRLRQRNTLELNYQKSRKEWQDKAKIYNDRIKQEEMTTTETAQVKKKMALGELDELLRQRNFLSAQIRDAELKMLLLKKRMDNAKGMQIPDSMIEQELNKDETLRQSSIRLQQMKDALTEEKSRAASDNSPSVIRFTQRVRAMEDDIEDRKSELREQIAEHVAGMTDGSGNFTIPALELERDALKANLESVMTTLDKQMLEVQKLDRFSADLEAKKSELDELRQIISRMSTELKLWKVELDADARITVIEPATKPQTNDAIRKYLGVSVATVLGFALVLVGVAYVEFYSRRLNSTSDINEGLGIRVMGDLPPLGGRNWKALRNSEDPQGALQTLLAESIDGVRTTLIHSSSVRSPRVVMVTSAESHEGKTTVASQLAASLARSGRRTLLVDGDLRNPAAHRVFDLPQEPGVCDLLRGQVERDVVIQPTRTTNLWLLPAGRCCVQSIQSLSNENLANLLSQLKAEYDFIVIDSAPVLTVADPLLLGQHVDAAVISVLRDHSKVPKVYEACERLKSVGITILGAVVNGVREQALRPSIVDMQAMETAETE